MCGGDLLLELRSASASQLPRSPPYGGLAHQPGYCRVRSNEVGLRFRALCAAARAGVQLPTDPNLFGEAAALIALTRPRRLPFLFLTGLLITPDAPLTACGPVRSISSSARSLWHAGGLAAGRRLPRPGADLKVHDRHARARSRAVHHSGSSIATLVAALAALCGRTHRACCSPRSSSGMRTTSGLVHFQTARCLAEALVPYPVSPAGCPRSYRSTPAGSSAGLVLPGQGGCIGCEPRSCVNGLLSGARGSLFP